MSAMEDTTPGAAWGGCKGLLARNHTVRFLAAQTESNRQPPLGQGGWGHGKGVCQVWGEVKARRGAKLGGKGGRRIYP